MAQTNGSYNQNRSKSQGKKKKKLHVITMENKGM